MRDTIGLRSTGVGYVIVSSSLSSTPSPPHRVVELQRRRRHSRPHSAKDLSNRLKQFPFFCFNFKGESIDKLSNQFDF